ncbi:MAG: glycosyltransferase family 2 protein [Candidatus Berkelbacteria bacterium]|nr:glycosyltransferase family 2 protein [Candidatus Berkelbacteria bacterium]
MEKSKTKKYSISIFFPAYNEEENIGALLGETLREAKLITDDFEIIVVDDGSKDKTAAKVRDWAKKDKRIKLVCQKKNSGYGAAVWAGFQASKKNLIFFSDSDRQFKMKEIKNLIRHIGKHDAVVGYRNPRRDPAMRLLNAWGWKMLIRRIFKFKIRDVDCAFKLFKADKVKNIKVKSRGAMFSAELMIRLFASGAKIIQVPVGHYPRKAGKPTGASPKVIKKAFIELFEIKEELKRDLAHIPAKNRAIKSL